MYKLIIADDEYTIRCGLEHYINWGDLGFEVVNVFEDGFPALKYLEENHVDVLLTDINMPIMSGIKLISGIREKNIKTRCVVISGYDDFNNIRQLIPYGIEDYLLKPIVNEDIVSLFTKLKHKLDEEYIAQKKNKEAEKTNRLMKDTLWRQCFSDIFLKKVPADVAIANIENYGLDYGQISSCLIYTKIIVERSENNDDNIRQEALNNSIINYLKNSTSEFKLIDFVDDSMAINIVALALGDAQLDYYNKTFSAVLSLAIQSIESLSSIVIKILETSTFESLHEVSLNGEYNSSEEKNETETNDVVKTIEIKEKSEYTSFFSAINSAFLERNYQQFEDRFNSLLNAIKGKTLSQIKKVYKDVVTILSRHFDEGDDYINDFIDKLSSYDNVQTLNIYVKQFIDQLSHILPDNTDTSLERLMEQSLVFISDNYSLDISRNDVAEHVFLSSSYFSRCFKRVVGMKFIDYLTNVRIEKSCELLLDCNNKISDVCERVGYNSPSYFTRVFKCVKGVTPNEFIRSNIVN